MNLTEKLQIIYNKLVDILLQLKKICVRKIGDIPVKIDEMVIGKDKLRIFLNNTIRYEIDENDLKGVTTISEYTFVSCTNLISITLPESVSLISRFAFTGCTNLADIYLNSTTPPTLGDTNAIPTTTAIHVPIGSGDAYRTATNWSYHAERIVEDIVIE